MLALDGLRSARVTGLSEMPWHTEVDLQHDVILYRNRELTDPVTLTYAEKTLRRSQARFVNRAALTPQIDLGSYQCNAVIDWIDIYFELSRRTQYWKLNDRIEKLTGRKEFPAALNLGEGKTATCYKLRVQEPDLGAVRKVLTTSRAYMALQSPWAFAGSKSVSTSTRNRRARMLEPGCMEFWSALLSFDTHLEEQQDVAAVHAGERREN